MCIIIFLCFRTCEERLNAVQGRLFLTLYCMYIDNTVEKNINNVIETCFNQVLKQCWGSNLNYVALQICALLLDVFNKENICI